MSDDLWVMTYDCYQSLWPWVVLATVPNLWFGSRSWFEHNWKSCNGFYPINKPNCTERAVFCLVPEFRQFRNLAPIECLCSDRITIWYIRNRCSFACSFTFYPPLCNPIIIRCITVKNAQFSELFHSNSTNIDWIAKWRIGGERACKSGSFTYISYCDMIRTHILNWSPSSELARMRHCCM